MACQAVQVWILSGLVAAFLDLAIAYLLLCASAVAYFATKFLGFFGLYLPCPCDGMFINIHTKNLCLNRLLVDFPTQKISDVQFSVKQKFPFKTHPRKHDIRISGGDNSVSGILEIEGGEASCSSVTSNARKYDVKAKRVISHRPRSRLRQRRKYSSVSSCDDPTLHEETLSLEPYYYSSTNKGRDVDDAQVRYREYNNKAPTKTGTRQMNHPPDILPIQMSQDNNSRGLQGSNGDEKDAIRLLELTLEEERAARAALYIELEKERSAAATAADEAMAMILRLQEEKASIEMEARQYQRILEEKSAYDAEEMNILKEILVRREKEKHFLEKEVEEYRHMFCVGDEQLLSGDDFDRNDDDDPAMVLHQLTASAQKKAEGSTSFKKQGDSEEQHVQMSVCDRVGNMDVQEKEIVSVINSIQPTSKDPQECEKTAKELEEIQETNLAEKIIVTYNETETGDPSCAPNSAPDEASVTKRVNIETEVDAKRSSLEMTRGLPPVGPLRRSSMSALESEMLKIDSEVGRLRERLKLVQEGRERLSLSVENRERENIQLKLLEDIARQVQEIRQLTGRGKAVRQVSLPLPTSQVFSKKRRSRSVSSGFQISSEG